MLVSRLEEIASARDYTRLCSILSVCFQLSINVVSFIDNNKDIPINICIVYIFTHPQVVFVLRSIPVIVVTLLDGGEF